MHSPAHSQSIAECCAVISVMWSLRYYWVDSCTTHTPVTPTTPFAVLILSIHSIPCLCLSVEAQKHYFPHTRCLIPCFILHLGTVRKCCFFCFSAHQPLVIHIHRLFEQQDLFDISWDCLVRLLISVAPAVLLPVISI